GDRRERRAAGRGHADRLQVDRPRTRDRLRVRGGDRLLRAARRGARQGRPLRGADGRRDGGVGEGRGHHADRPARRARRRARPVLDLPALDPGRGPLPDRRDDGAAAPGTAHDAAVLTRGGGPGPLPRLGGDHRPAAHRGDPAAQRGRHPGGGAPLRHRAEAQVLPRGRHAAPRRRDRRADRTDPPQRRCAPGVAGGRAARSARRGLRRRAPARTRPGPLPPQYPLPEPPSRIAREEDRPSRLAPAATIASAASRVRIPPEALTPRRAPTVLRIRATACSLAPPAGWKPVDVFTKSAPARSAASQTATICSSVRAADSMITFSTTGALATSRTARISCSTASYSPARARPTLRTMSTSSAPLATDSRASNALTSAECWPEGNPHTVATFTVVSTGSIEGETQTENVPSSSASRSSAVTSAAVASGLSRVWSMRAAS